MAQILVIDDDDQLLKLIKTTLGKAGHDVLVASNGVQGLALLKQQLFDVVITDIIMPEKDGIEVIMAMFQANNRTAVIAISGGSQRLDAAELLETARVMKVAMVIPKPIILSELLQAIETVLHKKEPA